MNRVEPSLRRCIMPESPRPGAPVFLRGRARPNALSQAPGKLAGTRPRPDVETGREEPRELKDLRKTRASYRDEHVLESSIEILGHSVEGITCRHSAYRAPLAFRVIRALPQPTPFSTIPRGIDGAPVLPEAVRRHRIMRPTRPP
jgi:hypothetical protein